MSNNKYGWPTTRCFPRTMKDAFKNDVENAQWFFPPEKNRSALHYITLAAAFWMWVGLAYWWSNT